MTGARVNKIRTVLDRRQPDLTVLMENVHKPHNLAAIARSCDAVGIARLHAVTDQNGLKLVQKAAGGSGKWVETQRHRTIEEAYARLRAAGFRLLAAHCTPGATDFLDTDYTEPVAIVVGAELDGLSEKAVSNADGCIRIPLVGMVESLNVSVATALILFEAKRQREAAGLYDKPRLDQRSYQRLFFEWCQPQVAEYCRSKGICYPSINDEGEITEPLHAGRS